MESNQHLLSFTWICFTYITNLQKRKFMWLSCHESILIEASDSARYHVGVLLRGLQGVVRKISVCSAIWSTIFQHTKTNGSSPRYFWTMIHQVSQSYTIQQSAMTARNLPPFSNSLFFFGQEIIPLSAPEKTRPWKLYRKLIFSFRSSEQM